MKQVAPPTDKTEAIDFSVERGYADWKRAKVVRGLRESRDRDVMIPVEQIWRDLKLEG